MDTTQILNQYGNIAFALIILFGGRYGLRFFRVFKNDAHNFLLFATLWAIIFILIEFWVGTFTKDKAIKYVLTYTAVTSFYEVAMKYIFNWIEQKLGVIPKDDLPPAPKP